MSIAERKPANALTSTDCAKKNLFNNEYTTNPRNYSKKKGMVEMTIEQERKLQCWKVNCQYYAKHCIVYHGYLCIKLGGNRIPCQRSLGHNHGYPTNTPNAMKPRFVGIEDGWKLDDGR